MLPRRRALTLALAAAPLAAVGAAPAYAPVVGRPLVFPRDHGAHPDFRIEWWYLTGWLDGAPPLGFQITFFRARTPVDAANPSAFTATQVLIAHAALADPQIGRLLKDQRIGRAGFGDQAAENDTDIALDRWQLRRNPRGVYSAQVAARSFDLELSATPTQPLLLQGDLGVSRKGPLPAQASHYYSVPHLDVDARISRDGRSEQRRGRAWLDHEWSSTLLAPDAAGWDWLGINLDDGAALTAFQIRSRSGGSIHRYASLRRAGATAVQTFAASEVAFEPLQLWRSPRTDASYPVAQRVTVGTRVFETQPLFADQELDSRATAGAVYWEGASTLLHSGRPVGRGYLEMTGYVAPMTL